MSGTHAGGIKARDTNYKRSGRDFFSRIGAIGGRAGCTGGFYGDPERAAIAGARGGNRSRRGLKLLSKEPDGTLKYQVIKTGEILFLKDGEHFVAGKKYTAEEWANLQKDK